MSQFQSPQALTDLYRDLRDRRLLPLVVVLVVGMAVVPIALSSSPEGAAPAAPLPGAAAVKSNVPEEQIVIANPGVRDYQRRLDGETPVDPFVQKFVTPLGPADGASAGVSAAPPAGDGGATATAPSAPAASTPSVPSCRAPTSPRSRSWA
jgi:hypothetical protein